MHISNILKTVSGPSISFEFFPASTVDSQQKLDAVIRELSSFGPAFVSVTYGAGGSTRGRTRALVRSIQETTAIPPIPHLTCVNQSEAEIETILEDYDQMEVRNLLTLRGDPPLRQSAHCHGNDAFPRCIDLIKHIRNRESKQRLEPRGLGVAGFPEGHPGTPNRLREMDFLKEKIDAGADYICTQLFFDNRDFFDFAERCDIAGIHVPLIAGILPLTSVASMKKMSNLAGGARVPAPLLRAMLSAENDPAAALETGLAHAAEQCAELMRHGVDGIHFYTLNQSGPVIALLEHIGIQPTSPG